jgi:hypothetical protein
MSATKSALGWTRLARLLLLAAASIIVPMSHARAQNSSDLTLTLTSSVGNPTGADFVAGSWVVASFAYTVTCSPNRPKCALRLSTNGALVKPAGSITQLEYSLDGGAFTAVPSSPTQLGTSITTTRSGTIVIRYQLGWAGSPFTPASATAYSQPIVVTLQQGQP